MMTDRGLAAVYAVEPAPPPSPTRHQQLLVSVPAVPAGQQPAHITTGTPAGVRGDSSTTPPRAVSVVRHTSQLLTGGVTAQPTAGRLAERSTARVGTRGPARTVQPKNDPKQILVYPPPPRSGGIAVNTADYGRLDEGIFLNDAIIDFYLKYILESKLSERDRERTHVFNSFFYKRLTTRHLGSRSGHPRNSSMSPAEQRHARVKSWTKKVNLFDKDFLIIPVNQRSHWFLAIICYPGLTVRDGLKPVESQPSPMEVSNSMPVGSTELGSSTVPGCVPLGLTPSLAPTQVVSLLNSDDEDADEVDGGGEFLDAPLSLEALNAPHSLHKQQLKKRPCIFILDSMSCTDKGRASRVVATLRDYLRIEHRTKRGSERSFGRDVMPGVRLQVAQQANQTDCGVFVLQYVESFFENPIEDFTLPIPSLENWFPRDVIRGKRQQIANLISQLMAEQGVSVKLPDITFPSLTKDKLGGEAEILVVDLVPEPSQIAASAWEPRVGAHLGGELPAASEHQQLETEETEDWQGSSEMDSEWEQPSSTTQSVSDIQSSATPRATVIVSCSRICCWGHASSD